MTNNLRGADSFNLLPHLVALGIAYLLAVPIGWNEHATRNPAD